MNNLEYLNEISKSNRPVKAAPKSIPASLVLKIALAAALVIGLIIGGSTILNDNAARANDLTKQIYYRTTTLNEAIVTYNKRLKSSNLRAIGLALSSSLNASATQINSYFSKRGIKADLKPELLAPEEAQYAEFENILYSARLNGILDRIYANQVELQVALLLSLISQNLDRTKNEDLIEILTQYQSNLNEVYYDLQHYSNPSD